jgi:membrane protease YdiL (CAAX protease family)
MISLTALQRIRAFCFGAIGIAYYYVAQAVALHAAAGLSSADWFDLVDRLMLLFLLLLGYSVMGLTFRQMGQRQQRPFEQMGLKRRPGWPREFALGAALGWGTLVFAILPLVLGGGLVVTLWGAPRQWFLLALDLVVLLVASLSEELVFRSYALQRFAEAFGPAGATFLIALLAAAFRFSDPFAPRAAVWVAFFLSWLLSLGFLRTRALWLPWGLRFAWYASTALLFGLPIMGGVSRYSPVVQSTAHGPEWLTGGYYGPEAGIVTVVVLICAFYVLLRTTRDYAYRYATPEIVAAGIPVDIDAISKRQHEVAMGPAVETATPKLVQIGGQSSQGPAQPESSPIQILPEQIDAVRERDYPEEG